MADPSPGITAVISAAVATAFQIVGPAYRYFTRARLANRKTTLQEVAQKTQQLDGAYARLEHENTRLNREVTDLRTALRLERDERKLVEDRYEAELENSNREIEYIRNRCETCERFLRMLGKRLPEGE